MMRIGRLGRLGRRWWVSTHGEALGLGEGGGLASVDLKKGEKRK
jgi:hypothetical protein